MTSPSACESFYWWSKDGLRLHARDYAGPPEAAGRPVLLCLPGLTRNARDFEALARHLAAHFRVICIDLRGRGDSAWAKDPLTYVPLTYVHDIERLIAELHLERLIFVGTSLGGIITMLMAGLLGDRMVAAVLNDIGPVIESAGLQRVRAYVGKIGPYLSWMHCAHALQASNRTVYPHFDIHDWLAMAKRLGCVEPSGRIVLDYDPKIAEPFKLPAGEGSTDMWPLFEVLARRPILAIRGGTSDLLSAETLVRMAAGSTVEAVIVPGIGHAPLLREPAAAAAIDRFLAPFRGAAPS